MSDKTDLNFNQVLLFLIWLSMTDNDLMEWRHKLMCRIEDNEVRAYQSATEDEAAQYQTAANMAKHLLTLVVAELRRRGLEVTT